MTGRLRVALDVTPLIGAPSGVHQVTRHLLEGLRRRDDVEVRGWLLTARGEPPELSGSVPVRRSRVPARLAHRIWAHTPLSLAGVIAGSTDVIHGTNFVAPPGPRTVISVQDLSPVTHPDWCRPEVAAMAGPLRASVGRGTMFHASSQFVADELQDRLSVDPERIAVVHHGVEPMTGGNASVGRSLAGAERYVLILGTVELRKNVAAVTDAIDALPDDVRVVVVGPAGNAESTLGSGHPRLVRLPRVDDHTRASLMVGAAVLAFPSRYEGFGLPPLEALSVGTPVVATAVGVLPEVIGDELDLVTPGDDDGFMAALLQTLDLQTLDSSQPPRERLQERIRAMTWDRAAAEMVDVYRRLQP